MNRIKIEMPATFPFSARIPVRITDLNYGGHVGNDNILSIIHEARVQFLAHYGYSEMNLAGAGLIMTNAAIEFKGELFYGDTIMAYVAAGDFSRIGFSFYYKLEKWTEHASSIVVLASTSMVCYDYNAKKIMSIPQEARNKLVP
jgi:acyl-CoA thioesterase FadM